MRSGAGAMSAPSIPSFTLCLRSTALLLTAPLQAPSLMPLELHFSPDTFLTR